MRMFATRCLLACLFAPIVAIGAATMPAPQIFAPGVISAADGDACPAFLPDGRTVLFWRDNDKSSSIMISHKSGNAWSTPVTAPFSGQWRDLDPTMSPDGAFMLFVSNRPLSVGGKPLDATAKDGKVYPGDGMNIWRVDRRGNGWGEPVHLPTVVNTTTDTFAPSIAADGSIYYMARDPADGDFQPYRTSLVHGHYATPVRVMLGDSNTVVRDPVIAPDQAFIVFSTKTKGSKQPLHLAIAFRQGTGWSTPVDLGDSVNDSGYAMGGELGPDHRTLYFYSARKDAGAPAGSAWNNGKDNIWSVSLAPWLAAHAQQPAM